VKKDEVKDVKKEMKKEVKKDVEVKKNVKKEDVKEMKDKEEIDNRVEMEVNSGSEVSDGSDVSDISDDESMLDDSDDDVLDSEEDGDINKFLAAYVEDVDDNKSKVSFDVLKEKYSKYCEEKSVEEDLDGLESVLVDKYGKPKGKGKKQTFRGLKLV